MLAKVQLSSSVLALWSVIVLLILCGCSDSTEATDEQDAVLELFGDPYQIVTSFAPADPDFMPQLSQDTLVAKLTYNGGCRDHDFDLRHEVVRDTARLWLRHSAGGDDCEALVQDEVRLEVPDEVLEAPVIVLLPPQGGPPIMVRWGE